MSKSTNQVVETLSGRVYGCLSDAALSAETMDNESLLFSVFLKKAIASLPENKVVGFLDECLSAVEELSSDVPGVVTAKDDMAALRKDIAGHQKLYCAEMLTLDVQDWRLSREIGDVEPVPVEQQTTYTLRIQQAMHSGQILFSISHKELEGEYYDKLSSRGLNGMIEIRNGLPAISLGVDENEHDLHIVSDAVNGLYVVPDNNLDRPIWKPAILSDAIFNTSLYFESEDREWLTDARRLIAEEQFANHSFDLTVVDDSGWVVSDNVWKKPVFLEKDSCNDTVKSVFTVAFYNQSVTVESVSESN